MGPVQSVQAISNSVFNQSYAQASVTNSSTCSASQSNIQQVIVDHVSAMHGCSLTFNIGQMTTQITKQDCLFSNQASQDMVTTLANQLKANATTAIKGFNLSNIDSVQNIANNAINQMCTIANITNQQACTSANYNQQVVVLNNIVTSCPFCCTVAPADGCKGFDYKFCEVDIVNITQAATQQLTASCTVQNTAVQTILNQASTEMSATAQFSSSGIGFPNFVLLIVLVIGILCLPLMFASKFLGLILGLVVFGFLGYATYKFASEGKWIWQAATLIAIDVILLGLLILVFVLKGKKDKTKKMKQQKEKQQKMQPQQQMVVRPPPPPPPMMYYPPPQGAPQGYGGGGTNVIPYPIPYGGAAPAAAAAPILPGNQPVTEDQLNKVIERVTKDAAQSAKIEAYNTLLNSTVGI